MGLIQTNEMKLLSNTSEIPSTFASRHHMNTICTNCGKEMEFVEGDVIYGENWYHGNCWKSTHNGAR